MVQPIDYMSLIPRVDIGDSILKGLQAGKMIREARAESQQSDLSAQYAADLQAAMQNPTAQGFAALTAKYPQQREAFKQSWDMLDKSQQDAEFGTGAKVFSALQNGKPDIAMGVLDQQIEGMKNSGQDASDLEAIRETIRTNPQAATGHIGLVLSATDPDRWSKMMTESRAAAEAPYQIQKGAAEAFKAAQEAQNTPQRLALENAQKASDLRNVDSQIADRAGRLGLDRDKLQSEVEMKLFEQQQKRDPSINLGGDAIKIINDSSIAAVTADQSANQLTDLAGKLEKVDAFTGALGSAAEWYKNATGNQDAMTELRKEYARLRSTQVSKMLPPGAASDKDIELAMSGFPPATADPREMAGFLRGMAKLSQYSAATENAKSEWVNSVGHLGKPRSDINIDGIDVPAGTTFADFAKQYVGEKAGQRTAQARQAQIQNRSYMRFANPGQ